MRVSTLGVLAVLAVGCGSTPTPQIGSNQSALLWHAGNFRYLTGQSGDLVTLIDNLQHYGVSYSTISSSTDFDAYITALFQAIADSLNDGSTGDWCGVKDKAATAGYAIYRYYDTANGRWLVYSYDNAGHGQASFIINPHAKRDVVLEVPHE